MAFDNLIGRRILVVEDELVIVTVIEEVLQDLGCVVIGPVSRLDVALQVAADEAFDAAILDVGIRGGKVYPVAERLIERGIPFVLASGYGDWLLPENLRGRPRLTKPFKTDDLAQHVRQLFARREQ